MVRTRAGARYGVGHGASTGSASGTAPQRTECRLHSPAVSESGDGFASPGPSTRTGNPGPTTAGWFNDPTGRFEYRYHNGTCGHPTSLRTGSATSIRWHLAVDRPSRVRRRRATSAPRRRYQPQRHRRRRRWCAASSRSSSAGSPCCSRSAPCSPCWRSSSASSDSAGHAGAAVDGASRSPGSSPVRSACRSAVVGLVLTIVLVRAVERYENPPASTASIDSCVVEVGTRVAPKESCATTATGRAGSPCYVEFHALPSGRTIERQASVPSTAPGETSQFAVDHGFGSRRRRVRGHSRQRSRFRSASRSTSGACSPRQEDDPDPLVRPWRRSTRSRRRRAGCRCHRRGRARRGGRPRRAGRRASTSTRSARTAVDSRWAMAIVVRPSARCDSAREMRTSVSASTDDVASSSTQHVGVGDPRPQQGDELALAGRQLLAALADARSSRPSGIDSSQSTDVEAGDDGVDRRIDGPRTGEADVGGDRVVEQERLLRRRRRGGGAARRCRPPSSGTPPRRISPMVGSAKRAISRPSVVLPEPVAPTIATCWPAGMWSVDVAQHGVVGPVAVGPAAVRERHVADVDVERPRRQRPAIRSVAAARPGCRARRAPGATRPPPSASGRGPR